MAYLQKVTSIPNKVFNFSLKDFSGGMNNRSELLAPNEASRLINMMFTDDIVMERRKGTTTYNGNIRPYPVTFLDQFRPYTDSDKLVECDGHNLYIDDAIVCSVSNTIDAVNFQGKYFFVDGNQYRVYGKFPQVGSTFERIVGTPDANYVVMQIVNPPTGFTPLDTTYKQGVKVYDYTNHKVWYEPCANEIADAYKNGNSLPNKPRYIVSFNGRIYLSGSDKDNDAVYLTDVGNPYYAPATLGLQIPPDSDKILGLIVYDDSVVIGREKDIYHITGKTNNPNLGLEMFTLKKINTHTGFASDRSACVAHNFLFFLGSDGNAYSLSTVNADTKTLATSIISKQLDLFTDPFSFTRDDIRTATSFFYQDYWYVSIKNYVLIFSYRLRAWTVFDGLNIRSFFDVNDILIWGNDTGKLMKFDIEYYDDGIPFTCYWTSSWFDMDDANNFKQFREFFIVAHTFNDIKSDIRLTFEIDYADVNAQVSIANQISVWGKAVWGDRFITRNVNASLPFVIGRRGRGIRFTFTNGYTPSGSVATHDDLYTYNNKKENVLVMVENEDKYYVFQSGIWNPLSHDDFNQAMRVYQINGDYELRGKR